MKNVRDFGAVGDGIADDRAAFQAAIDAAAGAEPVHIPNGTYQIGHAAGSFWCLRLAADRTTLRGESQDGVILREAPLVPDSVQLVEVNAADVTIERLTLDGNRPMQSVSPKQQRHGIRCKLAPRCTVRDVVSHDFTGDGLYFYDGSDDALVTGVVCGGNQRNGLTLGGRTRGGVFRNSEFLGNGAQQFDSEGGSPIDGVTITGCRFDALGVSDDYVLTMTGHTATTRSRGWTVTHNIVSGPALAVYMDDLVYAYNTGVNPTTKPSLVIYRACDRILAHANKLNATGRGAFDAAAAVWIVGTGLGQSPGGVILSRNEIRTASGNGISAVCCRDLAVRGNTIIGGGTPAAWSTGLWVRTTRDDEPVRAVEVRGNRIENFGDCGVMVGGNGAARILLLDISDNVFADASDVASMTAALCLDSGDDHPVIDARQCDNAISGGTRMLVRRPPSGVAQPWGGDGNRWLVSGPA